MGKTERKEKLIKEFIRYYGQPPAVGAQAPGRVDLMGSHTDYNLGFVLTQAIDRNVWMVARPRADDRIQIRSLNVDGCGSFDLNRVSYNQQVPWANYIGGVAAVFQEAGYPVRGFDGLLDSTVPIGSGLSSSAALEVSTALILDHVGGLDLDRVEMALLSQRAENNFVGLNVGILDQYTSLMGEDGCVLLLDCRDNTSVLRPIADGIQVVVCDTRTKRSLTGSEYAERRKQCEEGVGILQSSQPEIQSLRDASLELLEDHRAEMSPVVHDRCRFIIEENQRVLDIAEAFNLGDQPQIARMAWDSFTGARDLYQIVNPVMEQMMESMTSAPGVIGARQAGAGFGGCMVAFVEAESTVQFSKHVYQKYQTLSGIQPEIYPVQASPGAGLIDL